MTDPHADPVGAMQAFLRDLGQPTVPKPKTTMVELPAPGVEALIVVVERVRQDAQPDYCIHGYAECYRCRQPCWLGPETYKTIVEEGAVPICMGCARTDLEGQRPVRNVDDKHHG